MKGKALSIIALLVVAISSVAGGIVSQHRRPSSTDPGAEKSLKGNFEQALDIIQDNYSGAVDFEALGKHSFQSMLHQLDPHSSYFTKPEFDDLQTEQRSRFYGIGVTIRKIYNRVYILSSIPGSPAYKQGLRYGDAIIAVNGDNSENWSTEQVLQKVRGDKGESVQITVERPSSPVPITVRIYRDEVKLPTIRNAFIIGDTTIGYIGLTGGFSNKTDEELSSAITRLSQDGMRQLILDLRGNPGGLLDQAIKVAQKFLAPGLKIVETRNRSGTMSDRNVPQDNVPETLPMVVLINNLTASASEIVAGALQDHDRALIIGESSFGKGLVQTMYQLWGGTGLTLTTAKYYTPSGRSIQREYQGVSFYDYYYNRIGGKSNNGNGADAQHTDLGREVFGGGGIKPDVEVKSPEASVNRRKLYEGVFDFVRQLINGQITGLREYRITDANPKSKISAEDLDRYPVKDNIIQAFLQYISDKPQFNIPQDNISANLDYVRIRILTEITTAAYGPEASDQVYLVQDVQLKKPIEQ